MKAWRRLAAAWRSDMTLADRVRVALAAGFPWGAGAHIGWVVHHGDLLHRGPAPEWAVWFWYGLCVVDGAVFLLLMTRPHAGLASGAVVMAVALAVNWTCFPTFEFGPNVVLLGLTAFGATLLVLTPWLWRASRWTWGGEDQPAQPRRSVSPGGGS